MAAVWHCAKQQARQQLQGVTAANVEQSWTYGIAGNSIKMSTVVAATRSMFSITAKLLQNWFMQAANAVGYGGESHQAILDATRTPKGAVGYFVELHIEQGPLLEKEATDIGVVTAIAAPAALEVHFYGDGGHAGAQLMPLR